MPDRFTSNSGNRALPPRISGEDDFQPPVFIERAPCLRLTHKTSWRSDSTMISINSPSNLTTAVAPPFHFSN